MLLSNLAIKKYDSLLVQGACFYKEMRKPSNDGKSGSLFIDVKTTFIAQKRTFYGENFSQTTATVQPAQG